MALTKIIPFNYGQYCKEIADFTEWVTEYVQKTRIDGRAGWLSHFGSYTWRRTEPTWQDGVEKRCNLHKDLSKSFNDSRNLLNIANNILKFGDMKPSYQPEHELQIIVRLVILSTEFTNPKLFEEQADNLCSFTKSYRVASHSKVYEILDPYKWTIYDSRVSIALASLAYKYWEEKQNQVKSALMRFPIALGRDLGHPYPDEFPIVGGHRQASIAFVYASWLLRQIAEILRASPSKYGCPPTNINPAQWYPLQPDWQVYHVEMALFMIGDKNF